MKKHKLKLPDGRTLRIRDGLDFPCPWCGLVCTVSLEKVCVMHPTPTCENYMRDENGPVEILRAANAQHRKKSAS